MPAPPPVPLYRASASSTTPSSPAPHPIVARLRDRGTSSRSGETRRGRRISPVTRRKCKSLMVYSRSSLWHFSPRTEYPERAQFFSRLLSPMSPSLSTILLFFRPFISLPLFSFPFIPFSWWRRVLFHGTHTVSHLPRCIRPSSVVPAPGPPFFTLRSLSPVSQKCLPPTSTQPCSHRRRWVSTFFLGRARYSVTAIVLPGKESIGMRRRSVYIQTGDGM